MSRDSSDWGVVHHISTEDGEEARVLRLRVQDVPEGAGRKQIKVALERAGRVFGEGDFLWGNHKILPRDEWPDLDGAAAEALTFTDLLDEAKGEKRVTVRFPIGLHNAAVKAARGKSFNQFCVDVMAAAVGYEPEPLAPALPRLAQMRGISEAEMAERMQKMAAEAQPTLSAPLTQKMAGYFANVAGMPAEQQKQRTAAFWSDPQRVQAYHEAIRATSDLSDEQLAQMGEKLGLSVEEVRRRMEKTRALPADFFEQGVKDLQAATPDQIKDTNLMLRDVFSGNVPVAPPADEVE